MPDGNHRATYGVFNKWKAEMTRRWGGTFDWRKATEADMLALSEKMFDAAEVPRSVRQQYWTEFQRMKGALQKQAFAHNDRGKLYEQDNQHLERRRNETALRQLLRSQPEDTSGPKQGSQNVLALLPYAEFWGIADDLEREILVKEAPADVQQNLKQVVAAFDNAMDEWLAGPEADDPRPSDEYIAYSAMRMAAYYI